MPRYILHVDMDAFFAAIEQRDNLKLKDKPVIVGADPKKGKGRGVVSTCSYEARKFGVHSALPIAIAYRKCPQGIFLPVDMPKYARVSQEIYAIFQQFTPKVEPVSIDEAFLDISGSFHLFGSPKKTAQAIKARIKAKTGLTSSVGCASTKMAAKIASDLYKPDALVEIKPDGLLDFLWPLDIGKIWGLGPKTKTALNDQGIKTIGQLAQTDLRVIKAIFGKNGEYFWELAQGRDEREVEVEEEAKSISHEVTFEQDTGDKEEIESALLALSEKVSRRLRREDLKGKTIMLKIRLEGFSTYTRAKTLPAATNFVDVIYKTASTLFNQFNRRGKKVRLVGVKVSGFAVAEKQYNFFTQEQDERQEKIHRAVDLIKTKFGERAIRRARKDL